MDCVLFLRKAKTVVKNWFKLLRDANGSTNSYKDKNLEDSFSLIGKSKSVSWRKLDSLVPSRPLKMDDLSESEKSKH